MLLFDVRVKPVLFEKFQEDELEFKADVHSFGEWRRLDSTVLSTARNRSRPIPRVQIVVTVFSVFAGRRAGGGRSPASGLRFVQMYDCRRR